VIHKVEYEFPGSFFSESTTREIAERDPNLAMLIRPVGAYAFRFFDVADDIPDLGPEYTVVRKPLNQSSRYFIGGDVFTADGVSALGGDHEILLANMRGNDYKHVIRCSTGNWQVFENGDVVMSIVDAHLTRQEYPT
jgi:hypothetical protein